MSDELLTVQNLTFHAIDLQKIEVYEKKDAPELKGIVANITNNLTSIFQGKQHAPTPCIVSRSLLTILKPRHSTQIDIGCSISFKHFIALQFEGNERKHRLRTPNGGGDYEDSPVSLSQYVIISHANNRHLSVAGGEPYSSWMQSLRDDIPLSMLSIPGTHNSPAHYTALPSVRCQCLSVKEQLNQGVRFLDIRVQPQYPLDPSREELLLVHGSFSVSARSSQYLRPLMEELYGFLETNPSESIIVSIKREGTGHASDQQLSLILANHYAQGNCKWLTTPWIPSLGEARGKIVLLRRFHLDEQLQGEHSGIRWGIDAASWADNTAHSICPSGEVCVQDFYDVWASQNVTEKVEYSIHQLQRSAERHYEPELWLAGIPQPFYINFLTASNFWRMKCWPERIAANLNPAVLEHLCMKHCGSQTGGLRGDRSTGIIVCDWLGHDGNWDIVRCIIGMNSMLQKGGNNSS